MESFITDMTINVHFLVATVATELEDNFDQSLCSVFTGPPDYPPMKPAESIWFPCPMKPAKYFKMIMLVEEGTLNISELELYGY